MFQKKRLYKQTLAIVLSFTLLFSLLLPPLSTAANTQGMDRSYPQQLLDLLPDQQGGVPGIPQLNQGVQHPMPQMPSAQSPTGMQPHGGASAGPTSMEEGTHAPQPPQSNEAMKHPVDVVTGSLQVSETEASLKTNSLSFELERTFTNEAEVGPFGQGWTHNLHSLLRIYAEYQMTEARHDGSIRTFEFQKDDPEGYIYEYDGDPLITYELDKGSYKKSNTGDRLERISQHEYVVTRSNGLQITYSGYFAPWREEQPATAGKMISQTDRYGNQFTYGYDDRGRVTTISDFTGRSIQIIWKNDLIDQVINPMGDVTFYHYDNNQRLVQVTKPGNRIIEYRYDDQNRLIEIKGPEDRKQVFTYTEDDQVDTMINALEIQTFDFDYQDNMVKVTNAKQDTWTYEIEDQRILKVTNPLGESVSYTYNEHGDVTEVTTPTGTVTTTYTDNRKVESKTYDNGVVVSYTYHEKWGLPETITHSATGTVRLEYDDQGNILKRENPDGTTCR